MKDLNKIYNKITYKFKNCWSIISEDEKNLVFDFSEEYKRFLNKVKTERECTDEIISIAIEKGFRNFEEILMNNEKIKPGMKIYSNNIGKSALLLIVGKDKIENGINILGTHIDVPRIDLKPFPLYQDGDLALFKTHYYGGIKKYQWTSIPIALHGVIIKKNGEKVNIVIGENENDPVFFISDLIPHLAKEQMGRKLEEGIKGEELNIIIGSIPLGNDDIEEKLKFNIMKILFDKYGITEDDFITAEIEAVPALKAKDVGFDSSLLAGYGHDDRVCSYAALRAILEIIEPKKTCVAYFTDKEEVGSMGNTGMESMFFNNIIDELITLQNGYYNGLSIRRSLANSKVLSGDVTVGYNPNFPDVNDKKNVAYLGKGVSLTKHSGSGGKFGGSDANAEFIAEVRKVFNESNVVWQSGEFGKVDEGGGGTIAYIFANYGAEVVDCGVPVLSMHSPYELVSKTDVYMTFKGYKNFLLKAL